MNPFRPEFEEALHLWARVSQSIEDMGFPPPILVGGAAAELYSGSAIATGDFDLVTPRIDILDRALAENGFVRPAGVGKLSRGWVHPHLRLGFEVVGSAMLDGLAERDRVMLFEVSSGDRLVVISIEDLIADRIGQFASGTAPEMLIQAKMIFNLHKQLDMPTWTGEFARKQLATMASKSSPPPRKAIKLEDFARELAERRKALGEIDMPRNSGLRRTESKKALLAAIKAAGGNW